MYSVNLIVTENCNLQCKYCFRDNTIEDDMLSEQIIIFLTLLNEKHKIDSCTITGGEPLLHADIEYLVESVSEITPNICLLTNGVLINHNHIDMFEKLKIDLHISLDSYESSYHENIRGKQQIVINKIKEISKHPSINGTICTVLSPDNINEITKLQEFAFQAGWNFEYSVLACNDDDPLSWINADSSDKQKAINIIGNFSNSNRDKLKLKLFETIINGTKINIKSCYFAEKNIVIFPNGKVYACYCNTSYYFGDVYNDVHEAILLKMEIFKSNKKKYNCFSEQCYGSFL